MEGAYSPDRHRPARIAVVSRNQRFLQLQQSELLRRQYWKVYSECKRRGERSAGAVGLGDDAARFWRPRFCGLSPEREDRGLGVAMGIVCDGTPEAARRIERVLWNDPATGVMRHADAGYEIAIDCAKEMGLDLPSLAG
jgi:hypothetical protein